MDNFVDISGIESSYGGFADKSKAALDIPSDNPSSQRSFDGSKIGQYITPENIAMAGQLTAAAFQGLGKSEQEKVIKRACGRRPLIGKNRKATYQQCVANIMSPAREPVPTPADTEQGNMTKIIIFSVAAIIIIALIIFLIIKLKKN